MNDPGYEGNFDADLSADHQGYWHIIVAPVDPLSTLLDVVLEVDITYYVLFSSPVLQPQS